MELDEFLEVSVLLDYYKNLLSDKQKEYMLEHFEEDYSLSEIAKGHGVSRQAVYDNIRRGVKILRTYEEKIGFCQREREFTDSLEELRKDFTLTKLDEITDRLDS